MDKGMDKGMQAASGRWKRQEDRLSPGGSRGDHSLAVTSILAH